MNLLSPAKFALLYQEQRKAVLVGNGSASEIVNERAEAPISQPATVEINGIVLHSDAPKSAAEAEKINKALEGANIPVIDLDKLAWEQIKTAASSGNLPPEYMMNDWVSDVCAFLRGEIKHDPRHGRVGTNA